MQDHKPRPKFLERTTPRWVENLMYILAFLGGALVALAFVLSI